MKTTLSYTLLLPILFGALFAADEKQTVGLFKNEPGAFQGYTLFSPRHNHGTFLINMEGELVHQWEHTHRVENAKLLPNGQLLRTVNSL